MENLRLNAVVHTLTSGAWEAEAGRFIVLTRKADFICQICLRTPSHFLSPSDKNRSFRKGLSCLNPPGTCCCLVFLPLIICLSLSPYTPPSKQINSLVNCEHHEIVTVITMHYNATK